MRIGLSAGPSYDFGWARATLAGVFGWQSDVAGVRIPTGGTVGVATRAAQIVHDAQISYGFIAALTIPLPF